MKLLRHRHGAHCGRHCPAAPRSQAYRRAWDSEQRGEAERIGARWPGWHVMYGVGSRRFYAIAAWQGCERILLAADTPGELERLMAEVEAEAARRDAASTARLANLVRRVSKGAA